MGLLACGMEDVGPNYQFRPETARDRAYASSPMAELLTASSTLRGAVGTVN